MNAFSQLMRSRDCSRSNVDVKDGLNWWIELSA